MGQSKKTDFIPRHRRRIIGKKVIVADTSALLSTQRSLIRFLEGNEVVIPIWVIGELDRFKGEPSPRGAISRFISNQIDELAGTSDMRMGVSAGNDGWLRIEYRDQMKRLPVRLSATNDHLTVATAYMLHQEEGGVSDSRPVVLVSDDTNQRLVAKACGLTAEKCSANRVQVDPHDLEAPPLSLVFSHDMADLALEFRQNKRISIQSLRNAGLEVPDNLPYNHPCLIKVDGCKDEDILGGLFIPKGEPHIEIFGLGSFGRKQRSGIVPLNSDQALALALLRDSRFDLVILSGRAGTGKSLLTLLVGYEEIIDKSVEQLTVFRPNYEVGNPIGFLPGDIGQKIDPFVRPTLNNLRYIVQHMGCHDDIQPLRSRRRRHRSEETEYRYDLDSLYRLIREERIRMGPINFVRGDTWHGSFVIVDDAQNLRSVDIKTLLSRPGEGTRVVLTGHTGQIDVPNLDKSSCGLTRAIVGFRNDSKSVHITLQAVVRSSLAERAENLLGNGS